MNEEHLVNGFGGKSFGAAMPDAQLFLTFVSTKIIEEKNIL